MRHCHPQQESRGRGEEVLLAEGLRDPRVHAAEDARSERKLGFAV